MPFIDYVPGGATYKHVNGLADKPNPANASLEQVKAAWATCTVTTVCVWEPLNGVGHASIAIGNSVLDSAEGETTKSYASWFPGGAGVSKANKMSDVTRAACTFVGDCLSEGDSNGGYRIPEHMIQLPDLSAAGMMSEWTRIRADEATYNLLWNNCSSIVARILRHGSTSLAQKILSGYWAHCFYWTPTDIKKYAHLLK